MLRPTLFRIVILLLGSAWASESLPAAITSFATGRRPLGIATLTLNGTTYAGVANSGDNSVSIYQVNLTSQSVSLAPVGTVTGIPSPYGVFSCGDKFLVTSPNNNSVRFIQMPQGQVVGTVMTGFQPYSATCYSSGFGPIPLTAVVSNQGDSTLTAIDVATFQVKSTTPQVPGARGFHGVSIRVNGLGGVGTAVAGTDSNLVTELQGTTAVFRKIPVASPLTVIVADNSFSLIIAGPLGTGLEIVNASAINEDFSFVISQVFPQVPNPRDAIPISSPLGSGWVATTGDSVWVGFPGSVTVIPGIQEATSIQGVTLPPAPGASQSGQALLITSAGSNQVYVLYVPRVFPQSQFSAQSAAYPLSVAPGSLASTFVATGVTGEFRAGSLPLPPTLGGVSLSVGGSLSFDWTTGQWSSTLSSASPAPLLYVNPTQINFQVPPQTPSGAVFAQLQKADGSTSIGMINVESTSPSIFSVSQDGQGQAAVLNQNYSQNSASNPGARGSVIQLYLTGAGATDPSLASGVPADPFGNPLVYTEAQPEVTINGQPAVVQFSGMAPGFVGLWQINVEIPQSSPSGPFIPLTVSAGVRSNIVTIAVQ